MENEQLLKAKYEKLLPFLNEKETRLVLAADAQSMGRGGLSKVSKITGVSRVTLNAGLRDLLLSKNILNDKKKRSRRSGGGRKQIVAKEKNLKQAIEQIVSPHTLGDPMKPLLWTSKSLRNIETAIKAEGYNVSYRVVGDILRSMEYSLQANRKTDEGGSHEDRDAQFQYINDIAMSFLASGNPVISVDCKKKELIGNFKNAGQDWAPKGEPLKVKVYDFVDKEAGKAVPYGVYDIANNEGWVTVGISHDTAGFAVSTIRSWWYQMGKEQFKNAKEIFITADGGGSNSSRSRLWKKELQLLADETGLEIRVSHFPPGTSKWNKIEHRLFCHISTNWRAKPLTSLQLIVDLIAATTTKTGLKVRAKLDDKYYEKGIKISDEDLAKIKIAKEDFHGEWNYKICPIIV